jgi:two-component system sensor histidine kinase AlgZ
MTVTSTTPAKQAAMLPLRVSFLASLPIALCMGVMALPELGHAYAGTFRAIYAVCYLFWILPIGLMQRAMWRKNTATWLNVMSLLVVTYAASVLNNALAQVAALRWGLIPGYQVGRIFTGLDGCWLALIAYCTIHALLHHYYALEASRRRIAEAMALVREAELRALQYQLQPHFLFNTLNSISSLVADGRGADATRMIARLGDLLRVTLTRNGTSEVTLADELSLTEHYLDIEKARLGQRLQVTTHVGPGLLQGLVPPLLLQPLVENAIRHGIAPRMKGGGIRLRIERRQDVLSIELHNDGVPPTPEDRATASGAIGLSNVRRRLETLYPNQHTFEFAIAPDGACTVRLSLPLRLAAVASEPMVRTG